MTENQEKELFNTLGVLVTEVRAVKSDVQDIRETQKEHSRILNEHSQKLDEHSRILNRLDAKTDVIAETVLANDKRLTTVEKDISDLRGGLH